jgi:hypothetical protein
MVEPECRLVELAGRGAGRSVAILGDPECRSVEQITGRGRHGVGQGVDLLLKRAELVARR